VRSKRRKKRETAAETQKNRINRIPPASRKQGENHHSTVFTNDFSTRCRVPTTQLMIEKQDENKKFWRDTGR